MEAEKVLGFRRFQVFEQFGFLMNQILLTIFNSFGTLHHFRCFMADIAFVQLASRVGRTVFAFFHTV